MEAEIEGYLTEFRILRKQIRDAVQDLDDEAANWQPFPGSNSVYATLYHMLGSNDFFVRQSINGQTINRDRDGEFLASGHLAELLDKLKKVGATNEDILDKLTFNQLAEVKAVPGHAEWGLVSNRWLILRLISHYSLHIGHIQLTRQLWERNKSSLNNS
jgi:hypothetical protein